ncbi:ATP-binding protein [Tolypothrix sp. FACHB-123]|uniref:ATP-binding protein n=1 Tax=Tolypothrix sp. FACHB-123 TaxID=2692868 RepID=UPI001F54E01D|nr:ATP-binding protein [Tolypothrix sp. FACHB-123]
MSKGKDCVTLLQNQKWQREQRIIELLSSLNYRTGELNSYLHNIACGVSELIGIDWTVVTYCQAGFETILASSIEMAQDAPHVYALHGQLTGTVMQIKRTLAVEDAIAHPEYGRPAPGYRAYLGIPLQTTEGQVFGTICSFHRQVREFTNDEIKIVELFAERAATAIDHYHLYQQQCKFNQILEAEVEKRTAELQAAQAKLLEQERLAAIGEFSSIIVHEIRNPLTTVIMGLKYFKKTILAEAAQERLELALSEASRLERLLSEILLYAKPQVLQLRELNVNEFIDDWLLTTSEMPEARDKKIEFTPALSTVKIAGDRDKLKQVLINIIRNACEAVQAGDLVKLSIDTSRHDAVIINVHNDGNPISPEILSQLFQPFFSTKPEGTGLGLAISKRIVNAHHGKLCIQSQPLTGTTVSIQLPVVP